MGGLGAKSGVMTPVPILVVLIPVACRRRFGHTSLDDTRRPHRIVLGSDPTQPSPGSSHRSDPLTVGVEGEAIRTEVCFRVRVLRVDPPVQSTIRMLAPDSLLGAIGSETPTCTDEEELDGRCLP